MDATLSNQPYARSKKCLIFAKVEMQLNRFFPAMFKNECDLQENGKTEIGKVINFSIAFQIQQNRYIKNFQTKNAKCQNDQ
jgi:hypothetical protein